MKLKKLTSILILVCLIVGATGITALASNDSDTPEIRVYDGNEALARTANERRLLDTWTVSISSDGSVIENSNINRRIEDPVVATFNYYYDGINSNNEPQYTVEMEAVGTTIIKKTKLQTKAEGLLTWSSKTKSHSSYTATNSITYSYTKNPPSNPYVYAKADITINDGTVYRIPQHKLTNAQ